jgi:RNA polymerase sigma-70 factor (ECF subfamily)
LNTPELRDLNGFGVAMSTIIPPSDLELIAKFQAGDQASFEELVSRYSSKAFSLASRLTKNSEDAEEVLQDVFVTVFRKIDGFEGKSSFSSWLYRITVNAALMKLRKRRQDQSLPMEDMLPQVQNVPAPASMHGSEGETVTLRTQIGLALEDAIAKLPDDYRPVFVLRDIDGLTSKEVGEILDLTIPAVKSRLHRSRLMLRKRLQAFYRDFQGREHDKGLSASNF